MKIKKYGLVIFIAILVIIICSSVLLPQISDQMIIKKYLADYGWHISRIAKSNSTVMVLDEAYLAEDYSKMKLDASEKLGIDTRAYIGLKVNQYICILEERGLDNQLMAEIWLHDGKIVCSAITLSEQNYQVKYWPVDMQLSTIREEIKKLKFPIDD